MSERVRPASPSSEACPCEIFPLPPPPRRRCRSLREQPSGDINAVVPPVPIPNTEVKRRSPDDSASIGRAKVGRCQYFAPLPSRSGATSFLHPHPCIHLVRPVGPVGPVRAVRPVRLAFNDRRFSRTRISPKLFACILIRTT